MKKVSASLDEDLLRRLDDYAEAHDRGRSEVLREALAGYLRPSRKAGPARLSNEEVVRRYREGYGKFPPTEEELSGWEDEEAWLEE